jgi:hypothetical protein
MALDSAVRLAAAPLEEIFATADEFANYIAGYDIKAQAEINARARRGW